MKYFSMAEMCDSNVSRVLHINNSPDKEAQNNLISLVDNILDPAREKLKKRITILNGFITPKLCKVLGIPEDSQHAKGEAASITTYSRVENKKLFDILKELEFDQLTYHEYKDSHYDLIYVSYKSNGKNRKEVNFKKH